MLKQVVSTEKAPGAIGPYSQAMVANGMVYTSGQLGINPQTGEMPESVEEQAHLVFQNLKAILEEANSSMENVVKTLVFLTDLSDFAKVNEIYAQYFAAPFPARSCIEISKLPKDGKVEIEAVAVVAK